MTIPSAEPTISRRVLAKGAAWAVPAAAVVAAAPAFATSPAAIPQITEVTRGAGCTTQVKWSGKATSSYQVSYSTNSGTSYTNYDVPVTAQSSYSASIDLEDATMTNITNVRVCLVGGTECVASALSTTVTAPTSITATRMGTSPNFTFTLTRTGGSGPTFDVEATTSDGNDGFGSIATDIVTLSPVTTSSEYKQFRIRSRLCGVVSSWTTVTVTT